MAKKTNKTKKIVTKKSNSNKKLNITKSEVETKVAGKKNGFFFSKKQSTIALICIICLILVFFGVKTFILDKDNNSSNGVIVVANANLLYLNLINEDGSFNLSAEKTGKIIEVNQIQKEYLEFLFKSNDLNYTFEQLIDEAVMREILYENAKKNKIIIDESFIEQLINNPAFLQQLESNGINSEEFVKKYKEEFKKDFLIQEYFNNIILDVIPKQPAYDASHILICYSGTIGCDSNRTKQEALDLIIKLKNDLMKDNSLEYFGSLAREFSDGPSSVQDGALGIFTKGQMIQEFEDATANLNVDEISDPVETQYGYHIIRLNALTEVPNQDVASFFLQSLKEQILSNANIVYMK